VVDDNRFKKMLRTPLRRPTVPGGQERRPPSQGLGGGTAQVEDRWAGLAREPLERVGKPLHPHVATTWVGSAGHSASRVFITGLPAGCPQARPFASFRYALVTGRIERGTSGSAAPRQMPSKTRPIEGSGPRCPNQQIGRNRASRGSVAAAIRRL